MPCKFLTTGSQVIGFLFILAALARAVLQRPGAGLDGGWVTTPFDPKAWAELIKAIVEFIKVAPGWTLLFVAGLILIIVVPRYALY
jgi:hypothetical protein